MITEAQQKEIQERVILMPASGEEGFAASMHDCGYYAILNLYAQCGLEPPSLQRMKEVLPVNVERQGGLHVTQSAAILAELGFPGVVAIGFIPFGKTARDVFPALLDSGFRLLITVWFTSEITKAGAESALNDADYAGMPLYLSHAVVPFAHTEDYLNVIVGWDFQPTHKFKYDTIPALGWTRDTVQQPLGIAREFLTVLPIYTKPKE